MVQNGNLVFKIRMFTALSTIGLSSKFLHWHANSYPQ